MSKAKMICYTFIQGGKAVKKIQRISRITGAIGVINGILVCMFSTNRDFGRFFNSPGPESLALTMFPGFFILIPLSIACLTLYRYPWRPILLVTTASVGFVFDLTQWILPAPFLLIASILDLFIYEQHSKQRYEKIIRHLMIWGCISGVFLYFASTLNFIGVDMFISFILRYKSIPNLLFDYIPLVYFALAFLAIFIRNHLRTAILGLANFPFLFFLWKYVILSDYRNFQEVANWYPWIIPGLMFSVAGWLNFANQRIHYSKISACRAGFG
jgi:hypothetical protein